MAVTTTSGGITWAVPLRPDDLCQHLQAYKEALPVLTALRLCHRFGKGKDVHVNRLPVEIEQAIEDIIFDTKLSYSPYRAAFEHFESRCAPVDHLTGGYDDIFEDAYADMHEALCEKCQADEESEISDECCGDCLAEIHEVINERMCDDGDWKYDCCEMECDTWRSLISQHANGKFAPYDKILLKDFGLEAYFATTRINNLNKAAWPDEENHMYHMRDEMKTTICYLTMPKVTSYNAEYETSEFEDMMPQIDIESSESCLIQLPTIADKEKCSAQFKRALRTLRLKPYVHPSQSTTKSLSTSAIKKAPPTGPEKDNEDVAEAEAKAAGVEWPQLIMLSKTSFKSQF